MVDVEATVRVFLLCPPDAGVRPRHGGLCGAATGFPPKPAGGLPGKEGRPGRNLGGLGFMVLQVLHLIVAL